MKTNPFTLHKLPIHGNWSPSSNVHTLPGSPFGLANLYNRILLEKLTPSQFVELHKGKGLASLPDLAYESNAGKLPEFTMYYVTEHDDISHADKVWVDISDLDGIVFK